MDKEKTEATGGTVTLELCDVLLHDLATSPTFPRRASASSPTHSKGPTPTLSKETIPPQSRKDTVSGHKKAGSAGTGNQAISPSRFSTPVVHPRTRRTSSTSEYSDSPTQITETESGLSKTKRKLQFNATDIFSFGRKSDESYNLSPGPRSPSIIGEGSSKKGDSHILKSDKMFRVAAKDIGVLERISHRAHPRSTRIRKPHEVFVELEEIRMDPSEGLEWAETARWIKFEEDVEEGSGRWGRPHISALTFHSLVELQRGLDRGCVLLDVSGDDFPSIVDTIVQNLVQSKLLPMKDFDQVKKLLLKKHKHTKGTTIWEKLKHSAADGTLHHIGEGLRRMSASNGSDATHQGDKGGHTNLHFRERKRTLSNFSRLEESYNDPNGTLPNVVTSSSRDTFLPLTLQSPPLTLQPPPTTSNAKKVTFTCHEIMPTDTDSSGYMTATPNSHLKDVTFVSPDSISSSCDCSRTDLDETDNEQKEEVKVEVEHEHLSLVKRHCKIMDQIPDEAESLTVMVGGVKFLEKPVTAFVRLEQSHLLGDLTEVPIPVRFIFLMIGPDETPLDYHEVGRSMATLMSDMRFHEIAYSAVCKNDFTEGMDEFLDGSLVLPPGDWDEDMLLPAMHQRNNQLRLKEDHKEAVESYQKMVVEPLRHSRKACGGMLRDLKSLASRYPSDYIDALNYQVFFSIIFLYISFLAPAIAFGGLMEEVTENHIGETETLFATGLCGILFGVFAVQPLTVLAFTGPVLVFESFIFWFAELFQLPYIEWRVLIGLWLMVILLILAFSELTFLVHYFTRFSEEVFIGITAVFFISEACFSIIHIFERNPLCGINYPCGKGVSLTNSCVKINYSNISNDMAGIEDTPINMVTPSLPRGFRICNQPNTALWSLILAIATCIIALMLRKLRYKKFLGKKTRRLVSDFGMLTAICSMVLVAYILRNFIAVEVLLVPPRYGVSNPEVRSWFVNPFNGSLSITAGFGAIIPAFLLAILIFIENQTTVMVINRPCYKLTKPVGYHVDLCIVAILTGICGILGIPFLCGAPVRSIQHLQALSVFTKKPAPGEKPTLVRIREQRVTNIIVHMLIIFTPFASSVLELIPISVILGVFFYLAYVSIGGVQLFKRIKLLFIMPKHHPNVQYVRKVRTWKLHLYTIIQVTCVALLYGLKLSPGRMLYPIAIVMLLPLKWVLGKTIFRKDEIDALDDDVEDESQEFDEFETTHAPY